MKSSKLFLIGAAMLMVSGCSSIKKWGVGVCHKDTCGNVFFEVEKPTVTDPGTEAPGLTQQPENP